MVAPTLGRSGSRQVDRVDDDQRDAAAAQLLELSLGELGGHQDHAVGVVAGQRAGPAGRPGVAVPDGGDGDPGLVLGAPVLDAAQDLHGPRAVQAVEHEVDEARNGAPARSGPAVLVLVEQALHPGAGVGGDVGPAVHDLRHGGQRDAGLGRDGRERGPACGCDSLWDAPSLLIRGTVGTVAAPSGGCSVLDGTLFRPFSRNSFDNDIVNHAAAIVT